MDSDLPVASWSISLTGVFMGNNAQYHERLQETTTGIVRVLRGQIWAPTFPQNSWEMMLHTARCYVSSQLYICLRGGMERGLCWEEPLELNAGPGSHSMSSLSLATLRHRAPRAAAAGELCRRHHPQHLGKARRVRVGPAWDAQPCSWDPLLLFALCFLWV